MHSMNICHNDIKPQNIVYSKRYKKLVFIDFGFTEIKIESVGFMTITNAKGSFKYFSDEMKNIFMHSG